MSTWYPLIKHLHLSLVALSIAGFVLRYIGGVCQFAWVQGRFARIAPHVVDTFLLVAGVSLAFVLSLNPLTEPWLGTKLGLLLLYIGLGAITLKRAKTPMTRLLFFVAAVAVFGQMIGVAVRQDTLGWFA